MTRSLEKPTPPSGAPSPDRRPCGRLPHRTWESKKLARDVRQALPARAVHIPGHAEGSCESRAARNSWDETREFNEMKAGFRFPDQDEADAGDAELDRSSAIRRSVCRSWPSTKVWVPMSAKPNLR